MFYQRYSETLIREVVRRHVEGRESYRVIAHWLYERRGRKVSPSKLQQMVNNVAIRCKSVLEMSRELRPRWDGFLEFDEKMCSVRGTQQWFYLAVDCTGDILHCRAVNELTVTEAIKFLEEVKGLAVKVRGVVTDLDAALTGAVKVVYAGIPHQYCTKHALAALEKLIGYREITYYQRANNKYLRNEFERFRDRRGVWAARSRKEFVVQWNKSREVSQRYREIEKLRDQCHRVLFAKNEQQAKENYVCLYRSRSLPTSERKKAVAFLKRHWDHLMMHHRIEGLPRTTNLVENVNKQLERRYKTIEAFQHRETANSYTNLLIAYLRQKPYTDCRGVRKQFNGKSRLQVAKVKYLRSDWIKNCLKSPF